MRFAPVRATTRGPDRQHRLIATSCSHRKLKQQPSVPYSEDYRADDLRNSAVSRPYGLNQNRRRPLRMMEQIGIAAMPCGLVVAIVEVGRKVEPRAFTPRAPSARVRGG